MKESIPAVQNGSNGLSTSIKLLLSWRELYICNSNYDISVCYRLDFYRYVPVPDDGAKLENAWNSARVLPEQGRMNSKYLK
jgi:hypothetical protein